MKIKDKEKKKKDILEGLLKRAATPEEIQNAETDFGAKTILLEKEIENIYDILETKKDK